MTVRHYRDLIVWQKSIDLAVEIYTCTERFPRREIYGLCSQMRRAAVSIPSNIAEGQGRGTTKEFLHFLSISRGSLQELESQIIIAHRLQFLEHAVPQSLLNVTAEVARILNGLVNSLTTDH